MKGIIFSITAGQGHNQTAKVLCDYFKSADIECFYMDVLEYINPLLSESVSKIYLTSTKSLPKIYGRVYRMCEKKPPEEQSPLPKITTSVLGKRLVKLLKAEQPDFIICTHVFAAILTTYLAPKIDKKIKTIGIVTDFTIHPYWEDTDLDYYITASDVLTNQGVKKGLSAEKFKAFGIPIDTKFANSYSREDALSLLNLPDKPTLLVMSGSMGFGDIKSEILALDKLDIDFQIITICGNNSKLKESLEALDTKKDLYVYGYSNNVNLFMDAADCIITKPGGLTTSEALAKKLPIIMNNPIPGQEDRNVEFLLNAGVAINVTKTYHIDDAIVQLFSGDRRKLMVSSMENLGKPNSTQRLAEFVTEIIS